MTVNEKSAEEVENAIESGMTSDKARKPPPSTPKQSKPKAMKTESASKKPAAKSLKPSSKILKEEKSKKKDKRKKTKMVRDSFTMPENEYLHIAALKKKCLKAGVLVKKSELLRIGLSCLAKLSDAALIQAVEKLEKIKTGRPAKA